MQLELKKSQFAKADGSLSIVLTEGDILKIETTLAAGGGDEILISVVPARKKNKYTLHVTVEEEDV